MPETPEVPIAKTFNGGTPDGRGDTPLLDTSDNRTDNLVSRKTAPNHLDHRHDDPSEVNVIHNARGITGHGPHRLRPRPMLRRTGR